MSNKNMNILKILSVLFKCIGKAFEDYFVDFNSMDNETYIKSSYKKRI
jgi:hypothetical protein